MKKMITLVTAAVLLLSSSSFAATVNDYVNEKTLSAFAKDFSGATNVSWEEKENFYLVEFKVNGVRFNAAYNDEGQLLASSKAIKVEELPVAVTQEVNKKYLGYEIGMNASELTFEGQTNYYLTISNAKQILQIKVDIAGHISVENKMRL